MRSLSLIPPVMLGVRLWRLRTQGGELIPLSNQLSGAVGGRASSGASSIYTKRRATRRPLRWGAGALLVCCFFYGCETRKNGSCVCVCECVCVCVCVCLRVRVCVCCAVLSLHLLSSPPQTAAPPPRFRKAAGASLMLRGQVGSTGNRSGPSLATWTSVFGRCRRLRIGTLRLKARS